VLYRRLNPGWDLFPGSVFLVERSEWPERGSSMLRSRSDNSKNSAYGGDGRLSALCHIAVCAECSRSPGHLWSFA